MYKIKGIVNLLIILVFVYISRQMTMIILAKFEIESLITYFTVFYAITTMMYIRVSSRMLIVVCSSVALIGSMHFTGHFETVLQLIAFVLVLRFYYLFLKDVFFKLFKFKRRGFNTSGIVDPTSSDFYTSEAWRKLRLVALSIHGEKCMNPNCGSTHQLQVDHIRPRSKYPHLALDLNNLQILCATCNRQKSNTTIVDYR